MQSDEAASARPGVPGRPRGDVGDSLTGRLLDGRYRIGTRIARGGMAAVYEAADIRLDRIVAVKIMHEGLGDDHEFAERFVREARAAAQISHPNVVAVYDQGDDHGTLFLAMEYIRGRTLRDLVREEAPMSPARALALLEPVVAALAAAHRAGLIHRDVKPENVLIASDGRIKVADFGLAKAVTADTQHTATGGVLIGTVSYLAPELVVDGRADPRADVYAAGVMLYELLTGSKPHEGESPIQVAYKHVHEDVPPPSAKAARVPAYVDALVARATARDRTLRPADAGILLHQLRRVAQALAEGVDDDPELTADLALAPAVEPAEIAAPEPEVPAGPPPVVRPAVAEAAQDVDEEHDDLAPEPEEEHAEQPVSFASSLARASFAAGPAGAQETVTVPLLGDDAAPLVEPSSPTPVAPREPADSGVFDLAQAVGGTVGAAEGGEPVTDLAPVAEAVTQTAEPEAVTQTAEPEAVIQTAERPLHLAGETPPPGRPGWSDVAVALREHTAPIVSVPDGTGPLPAGPAYSPGRPVDDFPVGGYPLEGHEAGGYPPDDLPAEPAPRRRRRWRGPLLLLLALLLVAGGGVGAWWFGYGRYTQTPAVIGLSQASAVAKIEDAGLSAELSEEYSETVPKGDVIKATPVAGSKVLDGSAVELLISLGKERYGVPKLIGLTEDKAQDRLARAHLVFGKSTGAWSETVKEGLVISQSVKPDKRVKPGTVVDLVLSKGRRPIRFADWTGKSAADAKAALEKKGLVVDDSELAYSDTVPAGYVLSQSPKTGTLYKGDTVTLVVSRGPELVTVPKDGVIAAGVDAARATLEALGFDVKVRKDPTYIGLGFVLRSDPEPGTQIPKGSTVTLYLI